MAISKRQLERLPSSMKNLLTASSMSRLRGQFQTGRFALISAFRAGNTYEENIEAQVALAKDVRSKGCGFVAMIVGMSKEMPDRSLFILGIDHQQASHLALKHRQGSYVWGENGQWAEFQSGNTTTPINQGDEFFALSLDTEVEDYYSQYRNKKCKLASSLPSTPDSSTVTPLRQETQ